MEGQRLDDAWEFIKFLMREDNARGFMSVSGAPPAQTKLQEEWFKQFECMDSAKVSQVYQGALTHGRESSNHLIVKFGELEQIWNNAFTAYFSDPQGDTAAVLGQMETDLTATLQKIKEEVKK